MAEVVAGFLGPAIEVVKCVAAPIKRQLNYLCCFNANIHNLKDEAEKLDDVEKGLQIQVDRAKDNAQLILPQVETWLRNSNNIKANRNTILNDVPNVESGCLKLSSRFSLSKRAKKLTDDMKELRAMCKFSVISQTPPPAATEAVPLGTTYELESRKKIEEDIMRSLRDKDVNMIGICGMGGIGKTTMAQKIMNRALVECCVDESVMVVVSQQVDKLKIQLQIAEQLGLHLEEETLFARAKRLRERLMGTKTTLLILDDVWKSLILEELGVPCESGGERCTILLTSRNQDVLSAMNVEKICGLQVLPEEEAWFLFRAKAGSCVDDLRLHSIAKRVVEECNGLPIALSTVGAGLKNEKSESIWLDALQQLRKSNPIDIPDIIAQVYKPLKLSYDFLESEHAKSIFLLCCLFGEDRGIPVDYLTCFCSGLRIFKGMRNLEEARNRTCALIKLLKTRFLLLDSYFEDHKVMHDVVRDVSIFIAKEGGYIDGRDRKWVSSFQLAQESCEVPLGLGFPNLRLLFLTYISTEKELEINDNFFEGMRDLHVLCIGSYSLTSLPHTTRSLHNLKTLLLDSCDQLETISIVGELVNLEILICSWCRSIVELPPEIKRLNRLKLLELTGCFKLQSIGRGIISSLVSLEELKMLRSFTKWEAENREERQNAALRELEALTNLSCLEIEIEDPALVGEEMQLSSKMVKFYIRIVENYGVLMPTEYRRRLHLHWAGGVVRLGHWIRMQLLASTEYLHVTGEGADDLDLAKSQNLKVLRLEELPELEQLSKRSSLRQNNHVVSVFANLSSVEIWNCDRLRSVGSLAMETKDSLSQLESVEISECEMMEQVFVWDDEDESKRGVGITKLFPKLKTVELFRLSNLTTLCEGIEGIEFPMLTKLSILECPRMRGMVSNAPSTGLGIGSNQSDSEDSKNDDDDDGSNDKESGGSSNADDDQFFDGSFHLFCQPQKVSVGRLKELVMLWNPFCGHKIPVSAYNGLEVLTISGYYDVLKLRSRSIFSSPIASNLVHLRELTIQSARGIVTVIDRQEQEQEQKQKVVGTGGERRTILFPKLEEISLLDLRTLATFCEWEFDVELPSLNTLHIGMCPNIRNFTLGSLTTPNLERARINREDYEFTDLNDVLRQQFALRKPWWD